MIAKLLKSNAVSLDMLFHYSQAMLHNKNVIIYGPSLRRAAPSSRNTLRIAVAHTSSTNDMYIVYLLIFAVKVEDIKWLLQSMLVIFWGCIVSFLKSGIMIHCSNKSFVMFANCYQFAHSFVLKQNCLE